MGFLAGALAEEDFLAGAMVATACGERGGYSSQSIAPRLGAL